MERWISIITAVVVSLLALGAHDGPEQAEWLLLKVSPMAILEGGTVRLECRIPRHVENRAVELGIVGVRTSAKTLNGDRAAVLHELVVEHIPCEGTEAYCYLKRTNDARMVRASLLVGCEQRDHE